ncbi:MAG: hypothetical protein IJ874_00515 [Ruminococcus sp.]|nr:hypothetical protein [Ruminococcus sp.]
MNTAKRIISAGAAALICISPAFSNVFSASAAITDENTYMYFSLKNAPECVTLEEDGSLTIDRALSGGEPITITADVYVNEPTMAAWYVSAKWKCSSGFIKLGNVVDPTNPLIPFAYAETNVNGELIHDNVLIYIGGKAEYNSLAFTCQMDGSLSGSLPIYGDTSSSYPLTSFDAVINPNTPCGDYDIHFLTYAEDYTGQMISEVNTKIDGEREIITPRSVPLILHMTGANPGDVNNDGLVDATDASDILSEYASVSTGGESILDPVQLEAANTNGDELVDAVDASNVLLYYSYAATTENAVGFMKFLSGEY